MKLLSAKFKQSISNEPFTHVTECYQMLPKIRIFNDQPSPLEHVTECHRMSPNVTENHGFQFSHVHFQLWIS